MTRTVTMRPIRPSDYETVVQLDRALYPLPDEIGATPAVLAKWYARHPELGMIYEETCENESSSPATTAAIGSSAPNRIVAVCCFIPLCHTTWLDLISGKTTEREAALQEQPNSPTANEGDLGLHLYHVEVVDRTAFAAVYKDCAFYNVWLDDLRKVLEQKCLRMTGFSALAVSLAGAGLVHKKLGVPSAKQLFHHYPQVGSVPPAQQEDTSTVMVLQKGTITPVEVPACNQCIDTGILEPCEHLKLHSSVQELLASGCTIAGQEIMFAATAVCKDRLCPDLRKLMQAPIE
ncbi:hypothetical protein CAOG_006459 [Capsaspora owczarzaki ATCC 30864]|uniref:Uncharacterized protein n=2 Tax=Capsaspora owczarzaki (strain ATCC 30864) TaxID=595528 RepID=A0A0D2WU39_CAPO3|nr:hypothetical protein CAOG_006459 [Capsaspora owczarzaki ATCC 30864]